MKLKIFRKKTDSNGIIYTLSGEMNVYSSVKLKDLLLKELKSSAGITLDLTAVEEADTSAFQLLLFLKREAEIQKKSFYVTEMSTRLKSIFNLYKETI